jgi:hypothetical protein
MTRAARWIPFAAMAAWGAALAYSTAAARVLYGDGAWFLLVHLITPHRFNDYDVQRTHASLITQAPILFGQRFGLDKVADYAALYAFGVFWIPAAAMATALFLARRQPFLLAANVVAIVVYGFGVNFINTEANVLFGLVWLCVTILALDTPAPVLRGVVLPIAAFAMLRIYEGMLLVGPVLFLWTCIAARRATLEVERVGLTIAGLLFILGAVIGFGGFLAPRDPANAAGFLASAFKYLRSPQLYLLAASVLAFGAAFARTRAVQWALAAASTAGGVAYLVLSLRLNGYYAYDVYYQNRAFVALLLPLFVAFVFAASHLRPQWLRPWDAGAALLVVLVPLAFAVAGDMLGTWRWNRYVEAFCDALAGDAKPMERLQSLRARGTSTAWPWTHPTMSVLLRERGSVALVPNVPGNFGWEPFPPDKAPSIPYRGLCEAPLVGGAYRASGSVAMLFADPAYPDSIESVRGLSHAEPWGRWSDGPVVEIRFSKPLPDAFDLHLRIGRAFGTNKGAPVKVKAGSQEQTLVVDSEPFDATLRFRGVGDADALVFRVPNPQSPAERGEGIDERKLGIGLISLRIVPVTAPRASN